MNFAQSPSPTDAVSTPATVIPNPSGAQPSPPSPWLLPALTITLAIGALWLAVRRGWLIAREADVLAAARPGLPLILGVGLYCAVALAALTAQATFLPQPLAGAGAPMLADFATQAKVLLVTYGFGAPMALGCWWWFANRSLTQDGLLRETAGRGLGLASGIKLGLLAALICAPVVLGAGQLAQLVAGLFGAPTPPTLGHQTLAALADDTQPLLWRAVVIGAVVLGVPIVEEVLYRGFLQTTASRGLFTLGVTDGSRPSVWPAIVLTSVVFVAAHASAVPRDAWPGAAATLLTLSLALGLVRARSGGVTAPIVMHALFNAANVTAAMMLG